MQLKKNAKSVSRALSILLAVVSLLLAPSCAKSISQKYVRPDYEVIDIDTVEESEEGRNACYDEYKGYDNSVINMCAAYYDLLGFYWDTVGIIAEYESIEIWDDDLSFQNRPANYLLRK